MEKLLGISTKILRWFAKLQNNYCVTEPLEYGIGDLVTYRKDLLGVIGYNGIVTAVFSDSDKNWYALIKWLDGGHYAEMFKHIELLVKAKDERK